MANLKLLPETSEEIEESIQLLKGGSLKAAFLGKYKDAELKLQVVCNPVMVGGKEVRKECLVSDSRDCSSHWLISDTGLVNLITKGCQPIIMSLLSIACCAHLGFTRALQNLPIKRFEQREAELGLRCSLHSSDVNYVRFFF